MKKIEARDQLIDLGVSLKEATRILNRAHVEGISRYGMDYPTLGVKVRYADVNDYRIEKIDGSTDTFVVVYHDGGLTTVNGRVLSNMYDLSDCGRMDDVKAVYAADENNDLVKVRLGTLRRDDDPEPGSIVYATSQIIAGERVVGMVHWSDH